MSIATWREIGRASVLIRMISSWIAGGWVTRSASRSVLVMNSASSSSACATCSCSAGGMTVLAWVMAVKVSDRVASMIAPANARPNESPNEPAAEFTPAGLADPFVRDRAQRVVVEL